MTRPNLRVVPTPTPPPRIPTASSDWIAASQRRLLYIIVSAFEGGPWGKINYANLSPNFDDMGYSYGFLQWNPGQGSDVKLFKRLEQLYPGVLKACFGASFYAEFMSKLDLPIKERTAWAVRSVNMKNAKGKYVIDPAWGAVFAKLSATPQMQAVQDYYAGLVLEQARKLCAEYGLVSLRALCLMNDIVTQNGSIKAETKSKILAARDARQGAIGRKLTEREFLAIIATKRAEASNPRWVADVKARKMTIVDGKGTVHGSRYDLDAAGLHDRPWSSAVSATTAIARAA